MLRQVSGALHVLGQARHDQEVVAGEDGFRGGVGETFAWTLDSDDRDTALGAQLGEPSTTPGHERLRARIAGLHCSLCAGTTEKALGRMDGVDTVSAIRRSSPSASMLAPSAACRGRGRSSPGCCLHTWPLGDARCGATSCWIERQTSRRRQK